MRIAPLAMVLAGLLACASEAPNTPPPTAECAARTTQGCTCSGAGGLKTCSDDGRWGACECSGGPTDPPNDQPTSDGGCAQRGRYFVDADGDGYGAGPQVEVCEPAGPGYSTVPGDCDDGDARAFPGQSEPQEGVRKGIGGGDFNCDGAEAPLWKSTGLCDSSGSGCAFGSTKDFWLGSVTPPCGGEGTFVSSCSHVGGGRCELTGGARKQRCL